MPLYLFYPRLANGAALGFEAAELASDFEALGHALAVLAEHETAVSVSTYQGERPLQEVRPDELAHKGDFPARPRLALGGRLRGCAILVVEDRFLQAEDLAVWLRQVGAEVVGPFADAPSALAATDRLKPTCALVDINLGDGPNFALGEALLEAGVPLAWITGYDVEMVPAALAHVPHLRKPVRKEDVFAAVEALCCEPMFR